MNIKLLENTFTLINPYSTKFAASFYQNLLQHQEMKMLLYDADLKKLEKKLTISTIVLMGSVEEPPSFTKLAKELVEKNQIYHILAKYHKIILDTLLTTLEHHLGSSWTLETKTSWCELYQTCVKHIFKNKKVTHLFLEKSYTKDALPAVKKLRLEAIARKSIGQGYYPSLVVQMLMEDPYFKQMKKDIGEENTVKIVADIVESANQKESSNFAWSRSEIAE